MEPNKEQVVTKAIEDTATPAQTVMIAIRHLSPEGREETWRKAKAALAALES